MSMQTLNPLDFITRTEMLLDSGWFRWLVGPTLLLVSGMWTLFAFRAYGALAFLIVVCLFIAFVRGGRLMPLLIAWPLCIASAFVPVDILPYRFGGQPRLVPVGIGCTTPLSDENQELGKILVGRPGGPMFAPKRVLIWYVPPSQDEFNRMSRWHLRMIAYAPVLYATDNHGRLPSMRTWQDAETALIPYAKEPQLFVQPQTGTHYLPNPHLSQCDFIAMSHPEHVLLYSEAQPAPDGKLGVVFADGHTDRLMPMEWKRLWSQAMPRPQADLSSKG